MSHNINTNDDKLVETLKSKVSELESQIIKMKKVISENDLDDEIEGLEFVSVEEQICVDGINHLAKLFKDGTFDKEATQILDLLHKNLRMIRGLAVPVTSAKKGKKEDIGKLLEIVSEK